MSGSAVLYSSISNAWLFSRLLILFRRLEPCLKHDKQKNSPEQHVHHLPWNLLKHFPFNCLLSSIQFASVSLEHTNPVAGKNIYWDMSKSTDWKGTLKWKTQISVSMKRVLVVRTVLGEMGQKLGQVHSEWTRKYIVFNQSKPRSAIHIRQKTLLISFVLHHEVKSSAHGQMC